eukprot:54159-Amphidinium_carterae.1
MSQPIVDFAAKFWLPVGNPTHWAMKYQSRPVRNSVRTSGTGFVPGLNEVTQKRSRWDKTNMTHCSSDHSCGSTVSILSVVTTDVCSETS